MKKLLLLTALSLPLSFDAAFSKQESTVEKVDEIIDKKFLQRDVKELIKEARGNMSEIDKGLNKQLRKFVEKGDTKHLVKFLVRGDYAVEEMEELLKEFKSIDDKSLDTLDPKLKSEVEEIKKHLEDALTDMDKIAEALDNTVKPFVDEDYENISSTTAEVNVLSEQDVEDSTQKLDNSFKAEGWKEVKDQDPAENFESTDFQFNQDPVKINQGQEEVMKDTPDAMSDDEENFIVNDKEEMSDPLKSVQEK